ncbi:MAG: hypothetical protein U0822_03125 [Anaerolineae bacterium]
MRRGESRHLGLTTPATYRIKVQGRLPHDWEDWLGDLALESLEGVGDNSVTTLHGRCADQAALQGVMATLYTLGYAIIMIELQDDNTS